jgi:uncharacterized protein YggT (Ycf19 family)
MRVEQERIYQDPVTGTREVVRTDHYVPSAATQSNAAATVINNIVWYIVGIVELLLALRLVFLLLGARITGFTELLYNVTAPLVAPFRGMFPAPAVAGSYFDTASIVAIVVYAIVGWAISALVDVLLRGDRA